MTKSGHDFAMHRTVASELDPISESRKAPFSRAPGLARETLCFELRALASKLENIAEGGQAPTSLPHKLEGLTAPTLL